MEMTLKELLGRLQNIADYHQAVGHFQESLAVREAITRLKQTSRRARG